jgi:hypothetical protein
MKKIIVIALLFVSVISFAQETPCKLMVETKDGKTLYKGERNYVNTNYENFRICIQYLYDGEKHCLGLTIDPKTPVTIEENSVIYVQFASEKEVELKLSEMIPNGKKIECRYAITDSNKTIFSNEVISGIYLSTQEYPQVEVPDLNKYTAKKIMERFNCAIQTINTEE